MNTVPFFYTGYKEFGYLPFFLDENFVPHYSFKINEKTGILQLKNSWLNPVEPAKYHLPDVNLIRTPNCALQCVRIFQVKVLTPNRKIRKAAKNSNQDISFAIREYNPVKTSVKSTCNVQRIGYSVDS